MFVHGDNLEQKENHKTKYLDKESRQYLEEIRCRYDLWKKQNEELSGPKKDEATNDSEVISQRVAILNEYKDFVDQQRYAEKFDSRSNLHSSILEEFMYYLFRDLVASLSKNALIGKSHTFKDIFFKSSSYHNMLERPNALIEIKDHDFAIGTKIFSSMKCNGVENNEDHVWDLPAVAIECKTYLDKTMLQDASTAAELLKHKNPDAMYIVATEWLKLTEAVNLKKFKIDQIYVLRKQKNTDREFRYDLNYNKNPIYPDIIEHLFMSVRTFLTTDWEGGMAFRLNRGFLI